MGIPGLKSTDIYGGLPCARHCTLHVEGEGQTRLGGCSFFFKIYLFYLFYFWLCWVFVAAHRLSLVVASGGYSSLGCRLLIAVASLVEEHGL